MKLPNHIFVYGTLRRGQHACRTFGLEQHGEFIGTKTLDDARLFNLGSFPGIHLGEGLGTVTGDLFKIMDDSLLDHLDSYEGYRASSPGSSLYLRKVVEVDGVPAWVYEYNSDVPASRDIASGDWNERSA